MKKCLYLIALVSATLLFGGFASAQYPIVDRVADKVIQKYQGSTCEQLWQKKGQPEGQREKEAINLLRSDPQMRQVFINRIAGPVANKNVRMRNDTLITAKELLGFVSSSVMGMNRAKTFACATLL